MSSPQLWDPSPAKAAHIAKQLGIGSGSGRYAVLFSAASSLSSTGDHQLLSVVSFTDSEITSYSPEMVNAALSDEVERSGATNLWFATEHGTSDLNTNYLAQNLAQLGATQQVRVTDFHWGLVLRDESPSIIWEKLDENLRFNLTGIEESSSPFLDQLEDFGALNAEEALTSQEYLTGLKADRVCQIFTDPVVSKWGVQEAGALLADGRVAQQVMGSCWDWEFETLQGAIEVAEKVAPLHRDPACMVAGMAALLRGGQPDLPTAIRLLGKVSPQYSQLADQTLQSLNNPYVNHTSVVDWLHQNLEQMMGGQETSIEELLEPVPPTSTGLGM